MTDFLIVGRGLAASVIMYRFAEAGISFKTIGKEDLSRSSQVAGGLWNPVVFKRMTSSWMAHTLVPELLEFYTRCEQMTGKKILYQRNIAKPFTEDQEKMLWKKRAVNELAGFLDPRLDLVEHEELAHCKARLGYGTVLKSGFVDMKSFLKATTRFFEKNIVDEAFDHALLEIKENVVTYNTHRARNILFCEGYLVKNNPYFNWIPLKPAKGETLKIKAPALALHNTIFNRNGFILRLPDGNFKVGATYEWNDQNDVPTQKALDELRHKLSQMIACDYEIVEHEAGVRPSSIDRRPIIGRHPEYGNNYIFNGLGTKGVMLAPYLRKKFVFFYLQKQILEREVNVERFRSFYEASKKSKD